MSNGCDLIKIWHDSFDVRRFFNKNNSAASESENSAYAMITDSQIVNILCSGTGMGNHADANFTTSLAIMGIDFLMDEDFFEIDDKKWQELNNLRDDCIEIKMVNERDFYCCIVEIPSSISKEQYHLLDEYLHKLADDLADILVTDKLFYYSDDYPPTNNITEIINYANSRVDYQRKIYKDPNLFGYTFDERKR